MKTALFYFTGTGNSLAIARDLAGKLEDTEIIPIHPYPDDKLNFSADKIGLVFPVYGGSMPSPVLDFIINMPADTRKYYFAVATTGRMPGAVIERIALCLKKRGLNLSAGFIIPMPGNFIPLYEALPVEEQQRLLSQAKNKLENIAGIIQNNGRQIPKSGLSGKLYTKLMRMLFSGRKNFSRSFWVNQDCTSCGTCEKICPAYNISLNSGKPVWSDHCKQCFACLNWCPENALQFGKNTPGRKRYHHPDIQLEDMCLTPWPPLHSGCETSGTERGKR